VILAGDRLQILALDRSVSGIGDNLQYEGKNTKIRPNFGTYNHRLQSKIAEDWSLQSEGAKEDSWTQRGKKNC
jgi:hypothetical protein